MSGRVEFEGTAARPAPEQLEQVLISVAPAEGSTVPMLLRARIDPDGTFKSMSLPPGRYRLRPGPLASWQPKSAMIDGRDILDESIDVNTADVTDVVLTFTDRPMATISGTVRGPQGVPDAAALVVVFPAENRLRTDFSGTARRMRMARTTKAGLYVIPGLPPGEYLIVAGGDELYDTWLEPAALEALARRATRVDISAGAGKTQDLRSAVAR
jgi:hypothetical protein